ncbi:alcohol dehydrogenase catalytic domain-containing protein [Streptomyces sp. PSKA54]|uniref:Alcohol dehydrogenase catalytic domain-containing protein n=1 Tax=Streptomyces himalayensis subsp. aureolus TaxID=2758039 RepID=A0A7W2HKS5_9ACTN|nr:alcohol dehydrogenase catalytic domain-containing protein [Streptomyces himalayensis]MBA4867254.1 alcohol dehydrogenase catalytic domain-containing protein [Streptomyces himalayensis subsp. aureolus]
MKITGAVLRQSPAPRPYREIRPLDVTTVELADPGFGELLVRIEAAGICHSDLSVINGNRPRPTPMLLGHEAAGVVEALGKGVRNVEVGDHVVLVYVPSCGSCRFCVSGKPALCTTAMAANSAGDLVGGGSRLRSGSEEIRHHLGVSAFATHAVVDRSSAVVIDKDVPFETAALFGCAMLTGYGAVNHTAGVRPGESAVVFGLGGVGLAAVMSAGAAGSWPVVAVDPVREKQQLALQAGASHACGPDELEQLMKKVAPEKFDWAFEAVGLAKAFEAAYAVTGRGGGTVSAGLPHPSEMLQLNPLSIVAENRRILGSYMGTAQPAVDIPAMIALWRAGRLPVDRLVSAEMALNDVNEAMEELAAGRAVRQIIRPHRTVEVSA